MIKQFKHLLALIFILTLIFSSFAFALTDISGHWAKDYIDYLIGKAAINGYQDGSFKPENTITTAEFTKILVASLGHDEGNATSGHWASNYLSKAKKLGLIKTNETEFNALDDAINRGMMARLIARALDETYTDMLSYKANIKDYNQLASVNSEAVLKAYRAGIITGYPDGEFKDQNFATRAEASTILARLLNPEYRKKPMLSANATGDTTDNAISDTSNSAHDATTDDIVYGTPERLAQLEEDYGYIWDYDFKEDTYLDNGLNIHEPTDEGSYDIYLQASMFSPLEPQHEALELYLSKWYDQAGIDLIMHSVKKKTTRFQEEVWDELYIDGRYTLVMSPTNGHGVTVLAFYDEKID